MLPFDFPPTEHRGGSRLIDDLVDRLIGTFDSIRRLVTNDRLITVQFTTPSVDVIVRHGLPGQALTWEVVDLDSNVVIWRSQTVTARRDVTILQASGAARAVIRFT
jgi:hypothetical protein